MPSPESGISIVVPVHNGARWLARTVEALIAQAGRHPFEVLIVDDASRDGSLVIAGSLAAVDPRVRVVTGTGRGAAAAMNLGVRQARYEIVGQVDQDVEVLDGWLPALLAALGEDAGAAQGVYVPDPGAPLLARVMALDLAQRYERIGVATDHVCTGNTLYRRTALLDAGLFDESMGYGYDNDLSYRLAECGHPLVICREAKSLHHWRATMGGYLTQQYGFGYGRLDVLARHPRRVAGDAVSPAPMMAHPIVLGLAIMAGVLAGVLAWTERSWRGLALTAVLLIALLVTERAWAGAKAARRHDDRAAWLFPVVHLGRDAAWLAAIVAWVARRLLRRAPHPAHSMTPREMSQTSDDEGAQGGASGAPARGSGPKRPRT